VSEVGSARDMYWSSLLVATVKGVPEAPRAQAQVLLVVWVLIESRGRSMCVSCGALEIGGKGVLGVLTLLVGVFVVCKSSSSGGRVLARFVVAGRLFVFICEVAPPSVCAASDVLFGHSGVVMGEHSCQFMAVPFCRSGGRLGCPCHYFACSDISSCGCVCSQNRI
jgi:hypothetical protein